MTRLITLHMEFVDGEPPGWRVVVVPESTTLEALRGHVNELFDGLPAEAFFEREQEFPSNSRLSIRDALGARGNRIDYVFEDDSKPLAIWHEDDARPETTEAYPRLKYGAEPLLDEDDPSDASTLEARELDGAIRGEWTAPEREASRGAEMLRTFIEASDLPAKNLEALERASEEHDDPFAEFEWATNRLAEVDDGVSPRMRRAFHEVKEAGIDIEVGLLDQLRREELYRSDTVATGFVADILAGLDCHDAIGPIVELLQLEPETNSRSFHFLGYALTDLDGPEFERVDEVLESRPAALRLNVFVALSNFNPENAGLARRIFELLDELSYEDKDFALEVLLSLHPESSHENILGLLDDFIEAADRSEQDQTFARIPGIMLSAKQAVFFGEALEDMGVDLGASRGEALDRVRSTLHEVLQTGTFGTYRKDERPGRNDPCPCGSGKKYKRCCIPN